MISGESDSSSLLSIVRNRVIAGLFVVVPIGVTLWLGVFIFSFLTRWSIDFVYGIIKLMGEYNLPLAPTLTELAMRNPSTGDFQNFWVSMLVRVASLLIIMLALFLVGEIAKWTIGRRLISFTEWIMLKVPMLNSVYSTTRQIGDALWSPGGGMFRQVVLIEYPHKDSYVLAFLTNENRLPCEISCRTGRDIVSVFCPTTPNPTSGFLLFLPRDEVYFLDMDIAAGMRLVISGGAVVPPWTPAPGFKPGLKGAGLKTEYTSINPSAKAATESGA